MTHRLPDELSVDPLMIHLKESVDPVRLAEKRVMELVQQWSTEERYMKTDPTTVRLLAAVDALNELRERTK